MAIYTIRLECGTIRKVVSKSMKIGNVVCIDWDNQTTRLSGIVTEIIHIEKKEKSGAKKENEKN